MRPLAYFFAGAAVGVALALALTSREEPFNDTWTAGLGDDWDLAEEASGGSPEAAFE